MGRKPTIRKNHPWLQPSAEARAFAAELSARDIPATINDLPLRACDPSLPDRTIAWRKKILRGEPLFSARMSYPPSFASTIRPLEHTAWKMKIRRVVSHEWVSGAGYVAKEKTIRQWERDHARAAPIRVRCPSCNRPIRLSRWFEHGCEKPLVSRDILAPFAEVTAGAAPTEYQEAA